MKTLTSIDSNDTTILPDATVDALDFDGNKNISFLPVKVDVSFPDLKIYSSSCSIKTVTKVHFKG